MKTWIIISLSLLSLSSFARGKGYEVRKAACSGKQSGAVCSFSGRDGEQRQGTCLESRREESVLVCKGPKGSRGNKGQRSNTSSGQ